MTVVGLATCAEHRELTAGDRQLARQLQLLGADTLPVVWNDDGTPAGMDALVIRSVWDYHLHRDRFLEWIRALSDGGVRVFNDPETIAWNSDKRYLNDLAGAGVGVVPTRFVNAPGAPPLAAILLDSGWESAVVKPAVSASAHETWRVGPGVTALDQQRFTSLLERGPVMVQPFVREILSGGEWSLIMIDGRFSHAVLKEAARGDFRVQVEYGGRYRSVPPPARIMRAAVRIMDAVPHPWVYARVDGCTVAEEFQLMELELIEPDLFLEVEPEAAAVFAAAIMAGV